MFLITAAADYVEDTEGEKPLIYHQRVKFEIDSAGKSTVILVQIVCGDQLLTPSKYGMKSAQ